MLQGLLPTGMILIDGGPMEWYIRKMMTKDCLKSDVAVVFAGAKEVNNVDSIKISWPLTRDYNITWGLNLDGLRGCRQWTRAQI